MNNEIVGKSVFKTGMELAQNIDRGVQIVKNKNTLEAVNKVVHKVNNFYESIKDIKFTGENLSNMINILKTISSALVDLKTIKDSIVNNNVDAKPNPSL